MTSNLKNKVVFLDAGSVDYKDISLQALKRLGNLKAYSHTKPSDVIKRCKGASVVITNKCLFDKKTLRQLPELKCLCVAATGTNNVDLEFAAKQKIAVTNVAGYSTETVVQFTIVFILMLAGKVKRLDQSCHNGTWSQSKFFTLVPTDIVEVKNKVLGVIGYGTIGRRVAGVARSLGMKVLISKIPGRKYSSGTKLKRVSLQRLLSKSDFVTIHTPLSSQTKDLLNSRNLRLMKRGAHLINMGRGGIVDESKVRKMLKSGHLRGAAADVLLEEPPKKSHPLLNAPNVVLTPHIAWASREARQRLVNEIASNIKAFQKRKKRNRVI